MSAESRLAWIRRTVLRDWHGEEPEHDTTRVRTAASMVDPILEAAGANEGIEEEKLRETWREIAGDMVARHASPESLRRGCLTINVLQPSMRMHLEQLRPVLLKRLQEASDGAVKTVRFRFG